MDSSSSFSLNITMYPWFAMGHQIAFLHLSNQLAKKGHKITFLTPKNSQLKLEPFNLHPQTITFIPLTVPHVEGLPPNAETTADVPYPLHHLIMTAMDLTKNDVETHLSNIKPHIVFYDFAHWIPCLTKKIGGIKAIHYCMASSVTIAYTLSPERYSKGKNLTEFDLMEPPSGYPDSSIKLYNHEAKLFAAKRKETFGSNVLFYDRQVIALNEANALGYKTHREIEGPFLDYIQKQFNKPVLASGQVIPEKTNSILEQKWENWLCRFKNDSVVYCCFGSECVLRPNQFEALMLGLELTGMPFFAAVKPPFGFETIEEALPEGFGKRIEGKGVVYDGWVQQNLFLEHPNVGCFITHCGSGSLSEALANKCQLVLLPNVGDQLLNARMMGNSLKVGVEIEKGEDGLYTKDSVCQAVRIVMDNENEISKNVRANHAKIREILLNKDLESSYIEDFCNKLQEIVEEKI